MSEELKPCPFCGGAASLIPSADHSTACEIGCRDDTCPAYECVWDVNEASAIAAWNRRASPTPPTTEGREALEAATRLAAWNTVNPDKLPSVGMALADAYVVARALLSSPRVEDVRRMREALERIAKWFGEFPATGKFWDDKKTEPMSYSACFGSNGERDFMRRIALEALSPPDGDGKQEQATRAEDGPTAPTDRL